MMHLTARRRLWLAAALAVLPALTHAADLPPEVQAKVERAKKRLVQMAADPVVVNATREANQRDSADMNNGKWLELADGDASVRAMLNTKASQLIAKWEKDDDTINKIVLRDHKGNFVGGSTKPLIYNNAARPVFAQPFKGQPWAAGEIKPDTTTQIPSVHVAAPVLDGGKPIGVLHAGVTAK